MNKVNTLFTKIQKNVVTIGLVDTNYSRLANMYKYSTKGCFNIATAAFAYLNTFGKYIV